MDFSPNRSPVPARHGRRILIALLILALILLPLYLWPLRGGFGGLPGTSALSGWPRDPRNPAAVAAIPSDVWDALMGGAADQPKVPPKPAPKPRNLTMIAEHQPADGTGAFDVGAGSQFSGLTILPGSPMDLTGPTDPTGSKSAAASFPAWVQFTSESSNRDAANGSAWPGAGGFPGSGAGPFGSGPGTSVSIVIADPGDLSPPVATPEPATILLVGSNLALASAMAWKRRRRRREEETSIG